MLKKYPEKDEFFNKRSLVYDIIWKLFSTIGLRFIKNYNNKVKFVNNTRTRKNFIYDEIENKEN